jgi:enterobactin synthetase component D
VPDAAGTAPAPVTAPPVGTGRPDDLGRTAADEVEHLLRIAAVGCRRRMVAAALTRHDAPAQRSSADPADYRQAAALAGPRQRDFVLGRAALRPALAELGGPARVAVAAPGDRYRLPAGYTASVSHSRGLAAAVVAGTRWFRTLGVDLELGRLPDRAAHLVLRPGERGLLDDPGRGRPLSLLELFSAKEAAFKAFSPLLPDLPPVLRDIRLESDGDALFAWPPGHPGLRARVTVARLGAHGVFAWTGVRAGRAAE